jgi:hypothetical protein
MASSGKKLHIDRFGGVVDESKLRIFRRSNASACAQTEQNTEQDSRDASAHDNLQSSFAEF